MNIQDILKRRWVKIALCICAVLFNAYCIWGFRDMARKAHMRQVIEEVSAASAASQKLPPGIERAEMFMSKIKAIRTGYAPAEFKQALQDYISAFEQSLAAAKAGQDTTKLDANIAEAKQRIAECYRKYK